MVTLNSWFTQMGMHPWHSWQLANQLIPINSQCNQLVYESSWQAADRAGRADIRRAILRAEDLYKQYTNYECRPKYKTATIPWQQMGDYRLRRYTSANYRGNWLGFQVPDGFVKQLGYEHIQSTTSCAVTYTDQDGDGLYESATVTATLPGISSQDEVYITFQSADYIYESSVHEITPRKVTIVGNVVTAVIDTPTLVRPILYTKVTSGSLDPSNLPPSGTSPFVANVNVSRRFCDPEGTTLETAQAVLIWESAPFPPWAIPWTFASQTTDPSKMAYAIARGGVRDSRQGIVYCGEASYDQTAGDWVGRINFSECRPPDRVMFRYLAGSNEGGTDIVISRLAAAELARPICACTAANKELGEWQLDLSRTGATNEIYSQPADITNPLGSRRGHVFAWRTIQNKQVLSGILG